jgi:site-specific recombinase XerD
MAPQRAFKTLMGPYAVAWENRTGLLGMFTDRSHAVRTAVQREDFVRIVLARPKVGKEHDVPCHHRLDQCLHDYIEAAGITDDIGGYLFRTARRKTGQLTTNPLFQQDAHRIIRRRAKVAGIETRIGNHTFRATGITAYLKNSGKLEVAQQIANHESPRTTKLYDRRTDEISLDEIERITI